MSDGKSGALRVLRVADIPDNRTGGMSRTMYCTGDELAQMGHQVEYLFHESFTWNIPQKLLADLAFFRRGLARHAPITVIGESALLESRAVVVMLDVQQQIAPVIVIKGFEIGRASCRERV